MIGGFETHPAADIFPMMDEAAYAELVADMKEHGLRLPIVRWWSTRPDGTRQQQILDGRNRLRACSDARVTPRFQDVDDATVPDPYAYAISANLARRHLTEAQRAMIAARVYEVYAERAKGRALEGNAKGGKTKSGANLPQTSDRGPRARDEAAAALGVGARSVDHARAVQATGDAGLIGMVDAGQVAVSAAAAVAKLPAEQREEVVARGPSAVKAAAKEQREHQGAPLSEEQREAIVKLMRSGWTRAHVAERFRVAPMEVDAVMAAASVEDEEPEVPDVFQSEAASSKSDLELLDDAPEEDTSSTLPPGERDLAHDQWWTPPELAAEMVRLAGVQPGDHVLEPSAGAGAIVEALLRAGATVEAHELDPRWAMYLRICGRHHVSHDPRWTSGQVDVVEGNYLEAPAAEPPGDWQRAFKRAVINPPYKGGLDGLFLGRVLDEADVVVALLRVNALCGQERYRTVWEKHGGRCAAIHPLVIRPDFTGSDRGGEGQGAKSDFVVLVFGAEDLGERAPVRHLADRYGGRA